MIAVGAAQVSLAQREASIGGRMVPLGSRAFDVLEQLLKVPGQLVSKEALIDAVWPNVCVEDNNLAVQIHALRRQLKLDRRTLETVPGRGYRLNLTPTAPISPFADEPALEATFLDLLEIIRQVPDQAVVRAALGALLDRNSAARR